MAAADRANGESTVLPLRVPPYSVQNVHAMPLQMHAYTNSLQDINALLVVFRKNELLGRE